MPRQKKEKLIGLGLPANLLKEFIDLSYKGNTSIAPEGYDIDAPLSDSRVKVYQKKGSKEVIITHRGSVGAQDWWDNAKFFVAGNVKNTKSFKLHQERQLKAVQKYGGENIIGIGHSRAGLYLQQLQKDPATKLKEIITYNKAVGFYDALRTNVDEQTDVKVKNDFVSLLSGLQKRKNKMVEIEATKNPLDFNKAHQAEEISKLGDTFIGKKEEMEGGSTEDPIVIALRDQLDEAERELVKEEQLKARLNTEHKVIKEQLKALERDMARLGTNIPNYANFQNRLETLNKHDSDYNSKIDVVVDTINYFKENRKKAIALLTRLGRATTPELTGSGRAPSTKTLEELQKKLKTLEKQLINIEKGKVYKTTNSDKVKYEISYTKARIKNYETKGEDLIITKKAKYKDELPAKAKPYKTKPKKEPKPEEPKPEPKKEEPKKEEPKPKSKYKYINIINELDTPNFVIAITQSKELKSWIDWLNKLIEKMTKKDGKISRPVIFFTPESKEFLNELFEYYNEDKKVSPKVAINFVDEAINDLIEYLDFKDSVTDLQMYQKPLNTKNATLLANAMKKYDDSLKNFKEPKKTEPKPERKKEKPKPEPPKLEKQQAFLLGYKEIKEEPKKEVNEEPKKEVNTTPKKLKPAELAKVFENIIMTKDAQAIQDLLRKMGASMIFKGEPWFLFSDEKEREKSFKRLKSKRKFNKEEFVNRFRRENCQEFMCEYGINSTKEFRKWLLKNHPDKGGTIDDADFKRAIECAQKDKYCKIEGGYFWDSKEVKEEKKAKKIAAREAFEKERQERSKARREALNSFAKKINEAKKNKAQKGETAPKADNSMQMAMPDDTEPQQGIEEESEQQALGSGFYYLKEISKPSNPIFKYKRTYEIPTFIDPETEFLLLGGSFTDMAGMNCNKEDGTCFNPVWERQKIRRQILSEYKIWYNPFSKPPAGTIRMAWLQPMIEERFKPLHDEFVARRNVNIGLPADADPNRFQQQMFSNLTDGLSYVPIFNTVTSLGLTAASSLTDTKKEDGT